LTPPPTISTETDSPAALRQRRKGALSVIFQIVAGLAAFFGLVLVGATFFKEPLIRIGKEFVGHYGYVGMFLGTFISDAFSFPIAPTFYLLAGITSGRSELVSVLVVCAASLTAAQVAFRVGTHMAKISFVRRRIEKTKPRVDELFANYGTWAIAIGTLLPIPFSILCYLSGMYRMPARLFSLFILMRIPKLIIYYWLIRLGFHG
jgi:membrane protein YqaA with SNARE-associated domain